MSEIEGCMSTIFSNKEKMDVKNNILSSTFSISSQKDLLYEIAFLTKEEKIPFNKTIDMFKNNHLFHNHPNFEDISKQMVEMDHFMDKPFEVSEGVNICSKCKSKRTLSHNRQTRSGDEGMTVYVFCIDCKYRCTMNS